MHLRMSIKNDNNVEIVVENNIIQILYTSQIFTVLIDYIKNEHIKI